MLFHNPFLTITHLPDLMGIKIKWHATSLTMTDEDFKEAIVAEKNAIVQMKPRCILADTFEMKYPIIPELQDWHNEVIFPTMTAVGVQKLGIVLSKDIFTQISLEQLIDDNTSEDLQIRYFNSEQAAMEWLEK